MHLAAGLGCVCFLDEVAVVFSLSKHARPLHVRLENRLAFTFVFLRGLEQWYCSGTVCELDASATAESANFEVDLLVLVPRKAHVTGLGLSNLALVMLR